MPYARVSFVGFALLLLMPALTAQQRAPRNDSITQADLRADLFFLAGDSMRGRLTDTGENRAAADYIRSRFERMGLKPAGPNGAFFQPYNLMTATLGEGNRLDVIAARARRAISRSARSSIRSGSAPAVRPARR